MLLFLSRIRRDKDRFGLQIIAEGFFAIDSPAGPAGNALAAVRKSIGDGIVAVDLTGAIAELLNDLLAELQILSPNAGAKSVVGIIGVAQSFLNAVHWLDVDKAMEDFLGIAAASGSDRSNVGFR